MIGLVNHRIIVLVAALVLAALVAVTSLAAFGPEVAFASSSWHQYKPPHKDDCHFKKNKRAHLRCKKNQNKWESSHWNSPWAKHW